MIMETRVGIKKLLNFTKCLPLTLCMGLATSNSTLLQAVTVDKDEAPSIQSEITEADIMRGKATYELTCFACHGKDGKGAIPGVGNFTKEDGPLRNSDELLLKHIWEGFQSPGSPVAMPPKGGYPPLTKKDARDVLAFIRKEFGPQNPAEKLP